MEECGAVLTCIFIIYIVYVCIQQLSVLRADKAYLCICGEAVNLYGA